VSSFEAALATRDELERAQRMSAFLQGMSAEDLPGALQALETRNIGVTREEVRLFMLAWSRFDPQGAFAWARAWPTQWSTVLMEQAIYAWGFRDAPAALRALEAVEDAELQTRLRQSLLEGWLHGDDRTGASAYIADLSNPRQRGRLAFLLAAETMRDGPEAVMRWAEAVPETAPNDFKRGAFYHAATLVAREDPERAAEWFEAHRRDAYSAGSLETIARGWAQHHDPAPLFDWLRKLPSEDERSGERGEAIGAGFRVWLEQDPSAAEAWLSTELPDPALDPALVELVRVHAPASPAHALAWAARIDDEALRRSTTLRSARSWRRRDPLAAQAWLDATELPPELEQSILSGDPPGAPAQRAAPPPPAPAAR
jgi:hypothetical protein